MANVSLLLSRDEVNTHKQWWEVREITERDTLDPIFVLPDLLPSDKLIIVSFNDRVAPGAFSFFTSYG